MIKRPLNPKFSPKVLGRIKITTIRDKAWPVGVPIMLYNWEGPAYRSKQIDVAAIRVHDTHEIQFTRDGEFLSYSIAKIDGRELWETEGFDSKKELHEWFIPHVKDGQTITKHLMRFHLISNPNNQ